MASTSFDDPLQQHNQYHIVEKPYHCEFEGCNVRFKTKYAQKTHRTEQHTPNAAPQFICSVCSKSFTRNFALKRHQKKCSNIGGAKRGRSTRSMAYALHDQTAGPLPTNLDVAYQTDLQWQNWPEDMSMDNLFSPATNLAMVSDTAGILCGSSDWMTRYAGLLNQPLSPFLPVGPHTVPVRNSENAFEDIEDFALEFNDSFSMNPDCQDVVSKPSSKTSGEDSEPDTASSVSDTEPEEVDQDSKPGNGRQPGFSFLPFRRAMLRGDLNGTKRYIEKFNIDINRRRTIEVNYDDQDQLLEKSLITRCLLSHKYSAVRVLLDAGASLADPVNKESFLDDAISGRIVYNIWEKILHHAKDFITAPTALSALSEAAIEPDSFYISKLCQCLKPLPLSLPQADILAAMHLASTLALPASLRELSAFLLNQQAREARDQMLLNKALRDIGLALDKELLWNKFNFDVQKRIHSSIDLLIAYGADVNATFEDGAPLLQYIYFVTRRSFTKRFMDAMSFTLAIITECGGNSAIAGSGYKRQLSRGISILECYKKEVSYEELLGDSNT